MTDVAAPPGDRPGAPSDIDRPSRAGAGQRSGRRSNRTFRYVVAGGLYLVTSIGLWWHVWSSGPSTVMTCDCTDAGRMVWYLEWSAFALAHGHQLLYSNWLFHPVGFNLLSDTSAPAIGVVMSPVTLLFGPVTAINVASTVIPALTALSMFWLLQRWVRWSPAAFVGGLAYGFSAAVIVQLMFGWLNLACMALLPLMVACVDELYIRQRHRPVRVGVALAVLMTVEFFVSTEMVLIVSVSGVTATALLVGYAWVHDRQELGRRGRHALTGVGTAVAVTAILLAYPVWFFLAGPAHLTGMLWSTNVPGNLGNSISNLWSHLGQWGPISSRALAQEARALGGYRGPAGPSSSYLGVGLLGVVGVGTLLWRSDRRLWCFGALGIITAAFSLRVGGDRWGPWSLVYHLPLVENVVQSRFVSVFGLCATAMVAIIVDRSRSASRAWLIDRGRRPRSGGRRWTPRAAGIGSSALASAVALVALVPVVAVLSPNLPVAVQPVTVPRWFQTTADRLPQGQVLLTYPFATADSQASIPWQAIGGMPYKMAGGGGPSGTVARAGANAVGFTVLREASVPLLAAPTLSAVSLEAVREAMTNWGVTMVVVPADAGLPPFQVARGTGYGVAFFTAVLGSAPVYQNQSWVWSDVARRPVSTALPLPTFNACASERARSSVADDPWARCIMRASRVR
jgi:hypothetical protein